MGRARLERSEVAHGTMTGFAWHQRWRDPVCDPCREAKRTHSRETARAQAKAEAEDAPRKAAWFRACSKLAERYSVEFREILAEEMRGVVLVIPDEQGESNEM